MRTAVFIILGAILAVALSCEPNEEERKAWKPATEIDKFRNEGNGSNCYPVFDYKNFVQWKREHQFAGNWSIASCLKMLELLPKGHTWSCWVAPDGIPKVGIIQRKGSK